MARCIIVLPLLLTIDASASDPVTTLAGRYSSHFRNGDVTGASYWSDDVAEIVPVDRSHAYLRFELEFFNGHLCSVAGVAEADGTGLTYRDPGNVSGDGSTCTLHVERRGSKLGWEDGGSCKTYCGARGSFSGGDLPWSSKRPIRYLARLRNSSAYRDAVAEWRTGKPAR